MILSFRDRVYKAVSRISVGRVATYGQIAAIAGNRKAARVVGLLMRNNPNPAKIPCHRVVSGTGHLTGYSLIGGIEQKKQKLISEGVLFLGDKVDLGCCQWDDKKTVVNTQALNLIPGIGKSIEGDLHRLGVYSIADLKDQDPQILYNRLCDYYGHLVDRCVLYVFREAVYFASNKEHDIKKLKWWNWSDEKMIG